MKISVIMQSFLGNYEMRPADLGNLLIRAIDSFLSQNFIDSELIIVSDGCNETISIVEDYYGPQLQNGLIKLIKLPRTGPFKGIVRQKGIEAASGEIICGLDSDDFFKPGHLASIAAGFTPEVDWVYFNSWLVPNDIKGVDHLFQCDGTIERMNLSNIAWRRNLPVTWEGCDTRQDNKFFIPQLLALPKRKKIFGCGYAVTNVQIV